LGSAVALSLLRELGPVLSALMVTGRAGSAIAAELGTMRISEQIDALDTMNINPHKFLISPRLAAAIFSMPLLTALFDIVGILGGYISGCVMLGINSGVFFNNMVAKTSMKDVVSGLSKPVFFGIVIAGISCYRGFNCHSLRGGGHGSEGVGLATTSSVVIASVIILILDYILTALFFNL
jgi:phospholipid/cholesterol/gamma-HCH transport system permease protein